MNYRNYNPNPSNKYCGDCVIRAFAAATVGGVAPEILVQNANFVVQRIA